MCSADSMTGCSCRDTMFWDGMCGLWGETGSESGMCGVDGGRREETRVVYADCCSGIVVPCNKIKQEKRMKEDGTRNGMISRAVNLSSWYLYVRGNVVRSRTKVVDVMTSRDGKGAVAGQV